MPRQMMRPKKVSVEVDPSVARAAPDSPIASKMRRAMQDSPVSGGSDDEGLRRLQTMNVPKKTAGKPGATREDSTNEVFSPARWRQDSVGNWRQDSAADVSRIQPKAASSLPRGDPLGVLYTTLDQDPDVLAFMNTVPRVVPKRFAARPSALPRKSVKKKNTLVLDLDETLVHCTTEAAEVATKPDAVFGVTFNGLDYTVYMNKRPHVDEFLDTVKDWFEVVVFTASQQCYAEEVLKLIDPDGTRVQHKLFRGSCAHYHENFLKPLGILGRDLKSCFIVDNSPQCFAFELDNGIPCTSWFEDRHDNELLRLLPILREMKDLDDVRPFLKETFGVEEFLNYLKDNMINLGE